MSTLYQLSKILTDDQIDKVLNLLYESNDDGLVEDIRLFMCNDIGIASYRWGIGALLRQHRRQSREEFYEWKDEA